MYLLYLILLLCLKYFIEVCIVESEEEELNYPNMLIFYDMVEEGIIGNHIIEFLHLWD